MSNFYYIFFQLVVVFKNLQAINGTLQQKILDQHNLFRSYTAVGNTQNQPAATNMGSLVWDPALADVAQTYANTCAWSHNANRQAQFYASNLNTMHFASNEQPVGENLYAFGPASSDETHILNGVGNWYGEYQYWTYATKFPGTCATGEQCYHYTQLVSAQTRYVGCGVAICNNGLTGWVNSPVTILVCDYWPAGNTLGIPVYESATTASDICSNCPKDRVPDVDGSGLCDGCMSSWGGACETCTPTSTTSFCTSQCVTAFSNPDQCTDNLGRSIQSASTNSGAASSSNNMAANVNPITSTDTSTSTTSTTTLSPTTPPTDKPTNTPTNKPTNKLTNKPTDKPTNKPTAAPTGCCKSSQNSDVLNRYCKTLGLGSCTSERNSKYCEIDSNSGC